MATKEEVKREIAGAIADESFRTTIDIVNRVDRWKASGIYCDAGGLQAEMRRLIMEVDYGTNKGVSDIITGWRRSKLGGEFQDGEMERAKDETRALFSEDPEARKLYRDLIGEDPLTGEREP